MMHPVSNKVQSEKPGDDPDRPFNPDEPPNTTRPINSVTTRIGEPSGEREAQIDRRDGDQQKCCSNGS
jgi:hypothetical protein